MNLIQRSLIILLALFSLAVSQIAEVEPNNSRETAQPFSSQLPQIISSSFSSNSDADFYSLALDKNKMYYLTSIESSEEASPELELFSAFSATNLLTTNVAGRNGNQNFRLSGYVPASTGTYYAKIVNKKSTAGTYKIRLAGGRTIAQLLTHEPDNTIATGQWQAKLAKGDTVYGAIYPDDDVDYYRFTAVKNEFYNISTLPILDLHPRDADTFLTLADSAGNVIAENDDQGTVNTSSGPVNCTFSRLTGTFSHSGTYYVMVRIFYNTLYGETMHESNPGKGEYGLSLQIGPALELPPMARYPHIEIPTPTSVQVQWGTEKPQSTHLEWGETPACGQVVHQEALKTNHLVTLAGLQPQTQYFYRVITDNDTTECIDFHTAKPTSTSTVDFFVISDSSPYEGFGSSPAQRQIVEQIQKVDYDFGLHAGDINQNRGQEYELVYYQPYKDILKHAPIFTCIGNHDTYIDNALTYLASFNLPHNNPDSTERYYSFNYGQVHCISLDTNLDYAPGTPMYEWLVQDLGSAMRKETRWTFVYFHQPPWSEGWAGYPGEITVRTHLVPLFETYGVDMVFNGHTHDYERGFLNGVYYIITGGGGAPLESGDQAYDYPHVTVYIKQHHFTYIQTDGKTLTLRAINQDGETIDLHTFDKGTSSGIGIDRMQEIVPEAYALHANYPNPFNGATVIPFAIQKEETASLAIYDLQGKLVKQLIKGKVGPGSHTVTWDGTDASGRQAASGVYLVRLQTPGFQQTRQAVYLK